MSDIIRGNVPPKKPTKGARIGIFKPNSHNIETYISAKVRAISTTFGTLKQFDLLDVSDRYKF